VVGVTSPTVDPQYIINAQAAELVRVNDNRVYLIALVEQLTTRLAELEVDEDEARTD
jgi:hypothetical protein